MRGQPAAANLMKKIYLGQNIFGIAAIMDGVVALVWRDLNAWGNVMPLGHVPHPQIFLYIAGAVQLLGGLAVQWPRARGLGAALLGGIYLIFTLLWVPEIVAGPRVINNWGAPFYELSLAAGAMIVFGAVSQENQSAARRLARIGYVIFGICVVFFVVEQIAYFSNTVSLVPRWIPPGQVFWGVVTTIAFVLAAVALLSGKFALPAARSLTIMLLAFGFLIWVPAIVSGAHKLSNWTEHDQNLAIAGAAWIVVDYLRRSDRAET